MAKYMDQGKEDQIPAYQLMEIYTGVVMDTSTKRRPFQDRGQCLANREDKNGEIDVEDQGGSVRHGRGNVKAGLGDSEVSLDVGTPEAVGEDYAVEECK